MLGNVIPLIGGLGALAIGYPLIQAWSFLPAWLIAYLLLNRFGFFENAKIRRELEAQGLKGELVGLVFDRPAPLLDAHAEVGMLEFNKKRLLICTEDRAIEMIWNEVQEIKLTPNPHSLLGLGGWIKLIAKGGQTLKIESRAKETMLASRKETKRLCAQLKAKCPTQR